MGRVVHAEAGDVEATSTHRCCAERNVLEKWNRLASKRGVAGHAMISWIRRKSGGVLVVKRFVGHASEQNTQGCSIPCIFCRKQLEKYDFVVECMCKEGDTFYGRLGDPESPPSCLSSGQRRMLASR